MIKVVDVTYKTNHMSQKKKKTVLSGAMIDSE